MGKAFELNIFQSDMFNDILRNCTGKCDVQIEDLGNKVKFIVHDPEQLAETLLTYEGDYKIMADSIIDGLLA